MKTPAAPALAAMLHVVSAAPAVSAELPGVQKMVASYQKKYPDSPVDSGVLSGYNAAQLMGNNLEAACEAGGLSREDVVKAHRAQTNADTGLGTAQNFSDVDRPASVETYVLKPDAKAVGSVVNAEDAHTAPGVEDYLTSKSPPPSDRPTVLPSVLPVGRTPQYPDATEARHTGRRGLRASRRGTRAAGRKDPLGYPRGYVLPSEPDPPGGTFPLEG